MTSNATLTALIAAVASLATAIVATMVTYWLARQRDHESDWRKLKLAQYQEYVLALSGVITGRDTPGGHRRYADAVNSMMLAAPLFVPTNSDGSRETRFMFPKSLMG